jgi:hypothetical protein
MALLMFFKLIHRGDVIMKASKEWNYDSRSISDSGKWNFKA